MDSIDVRERRPFRIEQAVRDKDMMLQHKEIMSVFDSPMPSSSRCYETRDTTRKASIDLLPLATL